MKILITGGAGFIGSHLAESCHYRGHKVSILDNLSTGKLENVSHLDPSVTVVDGDIRDRDLVALCLRGVDVVFHLAAKVSVPESIEQPEETHSVNVDGTLTLLSLCRDENLKRFVFASSCAVYGDGEGLPKREEMVLDPLSPYALQKVTSEFYCKLFHNLYGIPTTALRFFNVYGPRQDFSSHYSGVIAKFVSAALKNDPLYVYGDGEQSRDFIFVKDLCNILLSLISGRPKGIDGRVFNVGTGKPTTLNDLIGALKSLTGKELTVLTEAQRRGDILHSFSDMSALSNILRLKGWTSLGDGLKECLDFYT